MDQRRALADALVAFLQEQLPVNMSREAALAEISVAQTAFDLAVALGADEERAWVFGDAEEALQALNVDAIFMRLLVQACRDTAVEAANQIQRGEYGA
jgi:CO/xanthine dehydrogenase FAD-binding subunit